MRRAKKKNSPNLELGNECLFVSFVELLRVSQKTLAQATTHVLHKLILVLEVRKQLGHLLQLAAHLVILHFLLRLKFFKKKANNTNPPTLPDSNLSVKNVSRRAIVNLP